MNEGVEWAVHCCLNLSWLEPRRVTAAKLAAFHDLPTAYLNKQLQALVRAGIVSSTSGPKGGFQLTRPLHRITLMDVLVAIEGPERAFRCTEIRQAGPAGGMGTISALRRPCAVAAAMYKAETVWRGALAAVTVATSSTRWKPATPTRVNVFAGGSTPRESDELDDDGVRPGR